MPILDPTFDGLTIYQLLGHLSYLLAAVAFLLSDILLLRLVAVAAASANLTFAYHGAAGPNWIAVFWQSVFITIHAGWSLVLIRERSGVRFSEEEKDLYQGMFRSFSPVEFMKLLRLAEWSSGTAGTELASAGAPLDDVLLIYNGEAEVLLPDGERRCVKDGAFIGEMSFIRGGNATADVRCLQPTRYLRWPKAELRKLLTRNPSMRATLQTVFSEDLTKKLLGPT